MGISNLTNKRVKNVKDRLLIKESLLIKCDKSVLNRTVKSFPLKLFD